MLEEHPTADPTLVLEPGTLRQKIIDRTHHAIACGALHSIPTGYEFVEQDGVRFVVRILSNLVRKDEAKKQQEKVKATSGEDFNPFLPYDEDLFVTNISDTHVCLLNKFNVVDHHILIITKAFEEQESLLNVQDFAAMWACLAEMDGLAFYNAGKVAGASQRHKHLQMVPYILSPEDSQIPIESLFASTPAQTSITTIPELPFVHAFTWLDPAWIHDPLAAAAATTELYQAMLRSVNLHREDDTSGKQAGAYNLLATRQWMLLVPRSQESVESIQVNSLGFAGALLVRNEQQMQTLKALSPFTLLSRVGIPLNADC